MHTVYDLPAPLLASLTLKTDATETSVEDPTPVTAADETRGSATSCALCGTAASSVSEQRAHFRSDWHRFNLKLKLRGRPAIKDEAEFERMLEGMEESLSGSESESEDEIDGTDGVAILVRKTAVATINEEDGEDGPVIRRKRGAGKPPLIWFSSPMLPTEVSLGVYRALFTPQEQAAGEYLDYLRGRQLSAGTSNQHIFMCMIGGGHFAAMIVSLAPKTGQGSGNREAVVLAHKTFHRYTTRRKQGGSQSANDNAKGAAHSAGAQIRRHNEATLISEVRELLASWKDLLDTASLLFIRATGAQNRRTLFGYDDAPLRSNDPRVRGFPFSTRRATQSELMRCFVELTRLKISRVDEAALQALQTPVSTTSQAKPSRPVSPAPPKLSKEEEEAQLHTSQLTALIRRSKAPAVLSYLSSNNLPTEFRFFPPASHHHAPTPLHLAAAHNAPAVVSALLLKAGADPAVLNADGKPPFLLAGDRATRDAFRIAREELGEQKWAWEAAAVPPGLKRAEVEERERREKEEAEKGERERREREVERIREEEAKKGKKKGGLKGMTLGSGGVVTGLNKREEEERGLTPEARLRLERERRARAAEERIRRMQGR
jgi:hypothetical protein